MNQEERNQKKKKREIKWIDIHTTTIQIYIYIAKSITHTTRKQKKKKLFFFFSCEKKIILHNLAIIDLVWFVYLFCRYEARPLNKSTDHTRRRKRKQETKWMVPGGNSQCSIFFLTERKTKTQKFSRQIDRYTLMKEREM
jgi:hypothetical protein